MIQVQSPCTSRPVCVALHLACPVLEVYLKFIHIHVCHFESMAIACTSYKSFNSKDGGFNANMTLVRLPSGIFYNLSVIDSVICPL